MRGKLKIISNKQLIRQKPLKAVQEKKTIILHSQLSKEYKYIH